MHERENDPSPTRRTALLGADGPLGVFVRYPILLKLAAISICAEISWATLIVVLQYHFKDDLLAGFASQLIVWHTAMVTFAFVACETILKYPMGRLSDRFGPRPMVFLALGICIVSPLLMTQASEWWHFIPLRTLDGVAAAALWPAMSSLMARSVPREAKSAAMSVFNGAYCAGLAIGPMLGLYLGHRFGNVMVFPLCSLVMALGLVIARAVLVDGVGDRAEKKDDDDGVSLLRGRPLLIKMMVLYGLSQAAVGLIANALIPYIDDKFSIKEGDLPRLMLFPALFVAVLAVPVGHAADKIGRPRAVYISYVLATLGMILVASTSYFAKSTNLFAPSVLLFGAGMMLLIASYILGTPAWLGLASVQVDEAHQAKVLSLMQTAQGFGLVAGLALVMGATPLLVRYHNMRLVFMQHWKSSVKIQQIIERFNLHFHLPRHGGPASAIVTSDKVPINVWFWASAFVFFLCLIGALLWVHEPQHHEPEDVVQQPSAPGEV